MRYRACICFYATFLSIAVKKVLSLVHILLICSALKNWEVERKCSLTGQVKNAVLGDRHVLFLALICVTELTVRQISAECTLN